MANAPKAPKTPKTAIITVNGKEYKLQHPGVRWYMQNTDETRNAAGVVQIAKYTQNLLDNVVTSPVGLKLDDFETVAELEELIQRIESFLKS